MKKGIHLLTILIILLSFSCSTPSLEEELEQYKLDLQAAENEADLTSTQLEKALKSNSQNEKQKNSIF